jgi:3-oxoacyl-[acyl-carrier protein] reductase
MLLGAVKAVESRDAHSKIISPRNSGGSILTLSLSGHVALVTGGSRGIGAAIAVALAEAGADIALNYRERSDAAESVARSVRATGRNARVIAADVSDSRSVARMVEDVRSSLGPVDILVNNAGIGMKRSPSELTEEEWDATIAVNLKGAFLCTQAVIGSMQARRFGRIVNISSGAARGAGGIGVHYNASKAGLEGLTRGYASRLAGSGITVNAVAPSLIETEMMPTSLEDAAKRIPVGRAGRPDEVAAAVVMVASNAYMTGQTVQLNGGLQFI